MRAFTDAERAVIGELHALALLMGTLLKRGELADISANLGIVLLKRIADIVRGGGLTLPTDEQINQIMTDWEGPTWEEHRKTDSRPN